jgi:ketosteroid isomerase-like protein
MVRDNALSLKFEAAHVDVSKAGDFAYTQGSHTMTMTDPATKKPVSDKASYVTVYRKIDGAWKAVSDIASSNTTPPAPAATSATATK